MNAFIRTALIFGILGGVVCSLYFCGVYYLKKNPFFSFWGNLVIIFVGVSIFISIYIYSRKYSEGAFSFGQGILLGGITALIICITVGIIIYVIAEYVEPGMVEIYKTDSLQHLLKNKDQLIKESSLEIYAAYLKSIPEMNAYNSVQRYIIANILIPGLMFSILSTLPLRRKKESI